MDGTDGQLSIFDFIPKAVAPGEWLQEEQLGQEMTFDEITRSIGETIAVSMSVPGRKWYKAVRVERIVNSKDGILLVYYDGGRQRGIINERYFSKAENCPRCAWRIKQG